MKKIGNDSIVLITIKQARDLDKKYDSIIRITDSISVDFKDYTKNSANRLQTMYNSYDDEKNKKDIFKKQAEQYKIEADKFNYYYTENKKIYKTHEDWWNKDRRHYMRLSLVLMLTTIFFAAL